jgi:hypothetical protein
VQYFAFALGESAIAQSHYAGRAKFLGEPQSDDVDRASWK